MSVKIQEILLIRYKRPIQKRNNLRERLCIRLRPRDQLLLYSSIVDEIPLTFTQAGYENS